jgi:hypothetical protein
VDIVYGLCRAIGVSLTDFAADSKHALLEKAVTCCPVRAAAPLHED